MKRSTSGKSNMKVWSRQRTAKRRQIWLGFLFVVYSLLVVVALAVKTLGSSPKTLQESSVMTDTVHVPEIRFRREAAEPVIQADLTANETEDCTPRAVNNFPDNFLTLKDTQDGGVFLHILISFYLFAALAIVCDDYFVPSLERICEDLGLQEDVAGATFMAAGSSAPELCTSIVGVFIAQSDVGVGTIVGSAVFNILCIIGLCALCAGMIVELTWYPLMRDTLFYLLSVLTLVLVIEDSLVQWYEAMFMLILYAAYITLMYFNRRLEARGIEALARLRKRWNPGYHHDSESVESQRLLGSSNSGSVSMSGSSQSKKEHDGAAANGAVTMNGTSLGKGDSSVGNSANGAVATGAAEAKPASSSSDYGSKTEENEKEKDEPESPWDIPDNFLLRVVWVAMVPVKVLCHLTVPDCRKEGIWRRLYLLTFFCSVAWIAGYTYILVWMITIAGDALGIPDTVMGLTLLAAGTSLPDCMSSIFVVRDGFGDMAVSNSVGSNVFDILICLGLPWIIETAAFNKGDPLEINSSGLLYSSLTLLATVVFLLASVALNKFRLNKPYGVVCLVVYVFVITLSSLYELNVFADLNPASCPR